MTRIFSFVEIRSVLVSCMRYTIWYLMDEIWEKAVETALEGEKDHVSARTLTLDGAVKCVQGRLPPPSLLERFQNLQHLSIANVGVSSLEQFPRLRSLQKLNLSDNRIAGGLEYLVEAGLDSLRDLDLSNNRIHNFEDLAPLAHVKLVSLDLYECPVTRVKDYRSRVFGLIKSLKYLDKMDAEENERPESDDEEEDDNEEDDDNEEEEDEEDPGSGEIDGGEEDRVFGVENGHSEGVDGVVDADEDEESDADEEVTESSRGRVNGVSHQENGFHVEPVDVEEDDDDEDSGEEIDEEEGDDEDVVEVNEIDDSDDDEDGVEFDEDDDDEDDDEVDNDEGDFAEPESTSGRLVSTEGEIDGHEQGEEDGDEDDNGETGEEEMAVEEEDDDDDDDGDDDDGEFEDDDEVRYSFSETLVFVLCMLCYVCLLIVSVWYFVLMLSAC